MIENLKEVLQPSGKDSSLSSKESTGKEKLRGKERHKDKSAKEEGLPSAAAAASVVSIAPVSAAVTTASTNKGTTDVVAPAVEELHTNVLAKGYVFLNWAERWAHRIDWYLSVLCC